MKTKIIKIAVFFTLLAFASTAHGVESRRNTPMVNVIKEWAPSVVNISTEKIAFLSGHPFWGKYGGLLDDLYNQGRLQPIGTLKLNSLGSGVIVSNDGLILTNMHVINMASKVYVTFYDGKQVTATLAAVDQSDDLALIKVNLPEGVKPVKLCDDIMIGETVVAVGNSLGLENSVTAGIISGVNRQFTIPSSNLLYRNLIQTDAPINPGSSGGALFNLDGQLVGVNLAVVQNAQSIGFAIPYTTIKKILKEYYDIKKSQ